MATPYTVGTGVPGPGFQNGGTIGLDQTLTGVNQPTYSTYGCQVPNVDPLQTPDWETAKVYFERKAFTDGVWTFADGVSVPYWGFEDRIKAKDAKPYPSPLIRLREGELAHVKLETRGSVHTIHHHGIEPTTLNDGVGHVSFETEGTYVYQWKPRHAGTWFYHCHVNTVLHFEMGLFGLLIVDPPEGFGYPFKGADKYRYDVEKSWVIDDVDPRWHNLPKDAGLCGEDVGLNIFKPKYFLVNGASRSLASYVLAASTKITATRNQRILIRLLNASYSVLGVKIKGIPSELISVDGHAIASPERPWSSAKPIAASEEILMPTAARHELWIDTTNVSIGRYAVEFKHYDWVTKKVHNAGSYHEGSTVTSIDVV